MKKEQILNLMSAIPPGLIEEADIHSPAKRRITKTFRAGLIAACLCLALIGTAAAVHYAGVRLVDDDEGFTLMQGGIAYIPYDSLSEEIRTIMEESDGHAAIQSMPSWQAVEDLIGIDLMNNPVLDASPAHNYYAEYNGVSGRFHVWPGNSMINAYGCFEIGDVDINVKSFLYTEYGQALREDWDETSFGIKFPDGSEVTRDSYTAPSGLTAQIIEAHTPRENSRDSFYCYGCFSLNGIPTVVGCYSDTGVEEARAVLHQILDGFILS